MPPTQSLASATGLPSESTLNRLISAYQQAIEEIEQDGGQKPGANSTQKAAHELASSLTEKFPRHGLGWKVLGALLLHQKQWDASLKASQRAAELLPEDASVYNNLGGAWFGLNEVQQALANYEKAIAMAPGYAKAHLNIARALWMDQRDLEGAERHCRAAIQSDPQSAIAYSQMGSVLELQNRVPQAIAAYQQALAINPQIFSGKVYSDMLHLMSHDVHTNASENLAAHKRFAQIFETPLKTELVPHRPPKDVHAGAPLRVGFVSNDLNDHALANYLEPLLRLLNMRPSLEVHMYYNSKREDAVTRRLKSYFSQWNDVADLSDAALAKRIRDDGIGVLIDANSHTAGNRLLTFARKPAPVQMSWLGYLGTTGLAAMDYYISDHKFIPPGELDWQFTEKMAWLPCVAVFEPNANAPLVNSLPALRNGYMTFGSFNRHNKINDAVLALWAMLLQRVPDARLVMGGIPEVHQAPIRTELVARGLAAERVTFFDRVAQVDFLALHHAVDFCLDTFPFCGGATMAHAAWMGVPTLTMAGELPVSHLGAAQMRHLGLDDFVANSIEEFLSKGEYWATHVNELSALRSTMRQRFSQSVLGDTVAYADAFETMLHTVWERWCNGLPCESFTVDNVMPGTLQPEHGGQTEPSEQDLEALISLNARQDYAQLAALAKKLVESHPEHGAAWKYLANALHHTGRKEEALAVLQHTVQTRPEDPEAHFNVAMELQSQGQVDDAVRSYLKSLSIRPDNHNAYNNLANIFLSIGLYPQAESYSRQALALAPDMFSALNNLGNALHCQGKHTEAEACYRKALKVKPLWAEAYNNLAICLKDQGKNTEAIEAYRTALTLKNDWSAGHSNLLYSLSLDVQIGPEELHREHISFGAKFEPPLLNKRHPHSNTKDAGRLLRIGFVSGDLYDHALANFLEPVFAGLHEKPDLILHAYYTHIYDDAVTKSLQQHFHTWANVASLSEEALAERIRADGIDILFDLSGHTAHNRLLAFAYKPAPVQVSYLGYLGTTGMQSMDYYLCDPFWVPPGKMDWQFTEKMAYLPGAMVYQPRGLAPEVNSLPALGNGHITLGSFNRANKINPSVIALWSMLLHELPTARMVLGGIAPERQADLFRGFMDQGIDINRLTFFPRSNISNYLTLHHQVDFCLDTFPFGGGTTNAWAAWMGVPTLCLAGETPASRFGASEMHSLGLDGFIADSIEDFIAKGCEWAHKTGELALLRSTMRERFANSSLGAVQPFTNHLHAMLRTMWRHWCTGAPPTTITVRQDGSAVITPGNTNPPPPAVTAYSMPDDNSHTIDSPELLSFN